MCPRLGREQKRRQSEQKHNQSAWVIAEAHPRRSTGPRTNATIEAEFLARRLGLVIGSRLPIMGGFAGKLT